jgi:short-subunit dehydrogenase involved in D-alanine esterification of teichoic acids
LTNFILNEANSIKDKVVIVTESSSGIRFEIAKTLSSKGTKVIIACRNETQGLEIQNQINGNFNGISESVKTKYPQVDILINNAGVMYPPFTKTNE